MPYENHFFDADLLPCGFQICDGTGDGVISEMWKKSGQAASCLIVEESSKAIGCEPSINFFVTIASVVLSTKTPK
jgi:hypothetical protein